MTTTDLELANNSELSLLPPSQPPAESARQMLMSHAEMMQTAYQLASKMVNTSMVPTRFQGREKAEDATAAILYGAELGLNPIQSLQRIIPIHGMPSMEARTMVALLKSRGYRIRTASQSHTSVTVIGWDLEGEQYESTWTIERAKLAGYVPEPVEGSLKRPHVKTDWAGEEKSGRNGKYYVVAGNMKYITDPQAMLKAKAQSEICRDMAPDVLLGISYTSEELQSERWEEPQARGPARTGTRATTTTVEEIFTEPAAEPQDVEEVDAEVDETPGPEPGQGGGNEQGQGAEPSSGAQIHADPVDQEPAPQPPAPEPAPKKAPAKKAAAKAATTAPSDGKKSSMRKALETRLSTLVGDIEPKLSDEDQIVLYRQILERPEVTSTNDLDDYTVAKVADQLYIWSQTDDLNGKVRDLLNAADLAAASAEERESQK